MTQTIFAEKVFTGEGVLENVCITCENGKIVSISPEGEGTIKAVYLSAGFCDIHINGGDNCYFTKDPTVESISDISDSSRRLGTAYTLPTLVTSPFENILHGVDAMKAFIKNNSSSGVLGMHLEGPFLSPQKRGAHLVQHLLQPTDALLHKLIEKGEDVIKIITIAPELFSDRQLQLLTDSKITVSAGHSNAGYEEAQHAFSRGIQLVTHTYNAMSAFTHRAPGLTGAILDNPGVFAPVILDGAHCDYAAARLLWKLRRDKMILISDALFTGNGVKDFKWGDFDIRFTDGKYMNAEGNLAGSAIAMGDAVRNAVNHVGIELDDAVKMATLNPFRALGLEDRFGKIQPGFLAMFTSFDETLLSFEVIQFN